MWASLLPGVRDLRAPLAAGYVWLLFGWLLFEPHQGSLGFIAPVVATFSSLDHLVSAAGLAVAASFAAYLIGSLSSTLTDTVQRGLSRSLRFYGPAPGFLGIIERALDLPLEAYLFDLTPSEPIGAAPDSIVPGTDPDKGTIHVPRGAVPFAFVVQGWTNSLHAAGVEGISLTQAVSTELRAVTASEPQLTWISQGGVLSPLSLNRIEELLRARVYFSDELSAIDLLLGARVFSERELIADGLLDEKSDMYGAVDRLRGEVELRDAMLLPLLALVVLVSVTVSPVWLVALGVIVGLALQRRDLDRRRTERLLTAVTWRPQRAPSLTRIERVVLGPIPSENRSGAASAGPNQTPGGPQLESEDVARSTDAM
jgi:hypothetical protein